MKKLGFGMFAVLITATLLLGFKNKPSNNIPPPVQKTLNGFDAVQATTMIANFAKSFTTANGHVSNDVGKKSVYAWYSYADIKNIYDLLVAEHATADGIRIYLGSDPKPPTSNKLKVHLFMVSTRKRTASDPIGNGSTHIDYYDHTATYLGGVQTFGDGIPDKAGYGSTHGALLYGNPKPYFPTTPCNDSDPHYLPNITALAWVQKRGYTKTASSDPSGYNTKSEWFEYPFIKHLFGIILNPAYKISGLRIYLGEGPRDITGRTRDVFILLPTKKDFLLNIHRDDYECIANYLSYPFNKRHYIVASDNGELCPDVCN